MPTNSCVPAYLVMLNFTAHSVQCGEISQLIVPLKRSHSRRRGKSRRATRRQIAPMMIVHVKYQALRVVVERDDVGVFRAFWPEASLVDASDVAHSTPAEASFAVVIVVARFVGDFVRIDG